MSFFVAFVDKGYARPREWIKDIWELDKENPENNGFQNQNFIVWMQNSALPMFRKIYRRVKHSGIYEKELPKGAYRFVIQYSTYN